MPVARHHFEKIVKMGNKKSGPMDIGPLAAVCIEVSDLNEFELTTDPDAADGFA